MRVGVFGGTFDPVHIGHLMGAEEARVRLGLDQVVFLPAGQPYLKADRGVTPAADRLEMVDLATRSNPRFVVSEVDLRRPGPTYTVDTLTDLRGELGSSYELYLVVGSDSLREIECWHRASDVLVLADGIVGMRRPGYDDIDLRALEALAPGTLSKVTLLKGPSVDVSSTELRERVAQGQSIRHLVPEAVEEFIRKRGLYLPGFAPPHTPQGPHGDGRKGVSAPC